MLFNVFIVEVIYHSSQLIKVISIQGKYLHGVDEQSSTPSLSQHKHKATKSHQLTEHVAEVDATLKHHYGSLTKNQMEANPL